MKNLFLQSVILIISCLLITSSLVAQSPQGIPYQAVMRNADGSVMASSEAVLTFMIHDGTADGTVVYQESHALTSNAQGLVSCVVGNGTASQGSFASINWGNGAKFLHVMMGSTDLGTQQMLSVPYALYSSSSDNANNAVNAQSAANGFADVSLTGDTLFLANGNFIIVPGISAANAPVTLSADSHSCGIQGVHNPNLLYGTITDQEGNSYKTILIGNQRWFAENLKTSKFRNGELIPSGLSNSEWASTMSGAFSYYNNDPNLNCPYGKLYNWYAVNDSRGLCPAGWHVSSNDDWIELRNFLGGDVSNVGGKLKAPGTLFWNSPNVGANNESGFTSIPGGARQADGIFNWLGYSSNYWTSTLNGTTAYFRNNVAINDDIYESFVEGDLNGGLSVRCIQDATVLNIQGCTDGAACNFMANANQDDGSCLYQNATCDDGNVNTINDVIDGSCVCMGTTVGNGIYTQGNGVTDIDGNTYTSIIINGQEWMQQNLAVTKYRNGDPIPTGLDNTSWSSTTNGAYAIYNNDAANNTLYGKLYNWYAVNDSRGLCPTGWHVPSDAEWSTFINYLDPNANGGDSYPNFAGGKMKATTGWNSPNEGASNESGFTGLPGGGRFYDGTYLGIGDFGQWWGITEDGTNDAWFRELSYVYSGVDRFKYGFNSGNRIGYSVRCVRD